VPIIIVHHTRKAEAEDLIDKVSGTFGLIGAGDTLIVHRAAHSPVGHRTTYPTARHAVIVSGDVDAGGSRGSHR
jgi:hypothetical protein